MAGFSGDPEITSPLAPVALAPERVPTFYEAKMAPNAPGGRGPLRFESGVATDTDIPNEFVYGMQQGYITAPGRPNHNANVYEKPAEQTIQERIHMGSAAWTSAPTMLGDFAAGAGPEAERRFVEVDRSGMSYMRVNPARVID
jgi:hypothetical protein